MRISTFFRLLLAGLLGAVILIPTSGWANTSKNCPTEPAQATIVSGLTYSGPNCLLKTAGDVDSFVFTASAGDIWSFIADLGTGPPNVCLDLWAPGGTKTHLGCTTAGVTGNWYYTYSALKLTASGTYTLDVSEATGGNTTYNLSVERLSPVPPDATGLVFGQNITAQVSPPTAQDAYSFYGATTGVYQIEASVPSPANNMCFEVIQPGGAVAVGWTCTSAGLTGNWYLVKADLAPTVDGTYVVVVSTLYDVGTVNYNLDVSCASGVCPPTQPPCKLTDALSYNATTGNLTMAFSLATPLAATWDGWLISGNTVQALWSQSQPITLLPVPVTKTHTVAKQGRIGVLSTLTASSGITCSSWNLVNTGK